MKLHLLTPALVAVLGLALAGTSHAQTSTNTTSSTSSSTSDTSMAKTNYGGTITAIDTAANTVTVQSKKHTLTLKVDSSTTFKGGAALSDYAVGDKVRGSYTKDASGAMTAASLDKKAATK